MRHFAYLEAISPSSFAMLALPAIERRMALPVAEQQLVSVLQRQNIDFSEKSTRNSRLYAILTVCCGSSGAFRFQDAAPTGVAVGSPFGECGCTPLPELQQSMLLGKPAGHKQTLNQFVC